MYDRTLTDQAIEKASASLGFELVRHTTAQIDAAVSALDEVIDLERGELRRQLAPDEQKFITNERQLCALDARYYLSRYFYIVNWQKQAERFRPNVAQSLMLDVWADLERQGRAIHVLQLKARRLGVSTLSEAEVARRTQFVPFTNAVVASADPTKSVLMAQMIAYGWERMPWWLLPKVTRVQNRMPVEFGEINTGITIQAGNQFNGVARGATPNVYHVCFAPECLVRTKDGTLTSVRDLRVGDTAIAEDGMTTTVRAITKSHRINEITADLWTWGDFAPLRTTKDHRVLTPSGWRQAGDLRAGDELVSPVSSIGNDHSEVSYERWSPGQSHQRKVSTETLACDRALGYLMGVYLAEGTAIRNLRLQDPALQPSAIVLSCDQSEVERFTQAVHDVFGPDARVGVRRTTTRTVQLQYSNAGFTRWVVENFGSVDSKRIPDWVWEAGRDFIEGLVEGYLDGDGHYAKDGSICATSIRVAIPINLRELVASLGWGWSAITYRSAGTYYDRKCQAAWTIRFSGETADRIREAFGRPVTARSRVGSPHWRYLEPGHVAVSISVAAEGFSPEVYDIEVEHESHAFAMLQGIVKNSEIAEWQDTEELIDGALLRAIIDTPNVWGMIEGTGKGRGNWLHKTWELLKQEWPLGRARQMPVFLPWYVGTDIYPSPAEMRARPVPRDWIPSDRTVRHAERAKEYVRTNPLLLEHLAHGDRSWQLSREQLWFYEVEYESARKKKTLNIFLAEMASDDFDAFQSSNIPVVDQEIILNYRERTRQPLAVYTIIGDGLPPSLTVSRREWLVGDDAPEPIRVAVSALLPRMPLNYQFVPVRFEGYSAYDPALKLLIWEFPQDGDLYGLGVDTSDGIGQDNSAVEVLRKASADRPDAQVAEFVSPYIKAFQLWPIVLAIGTFYSVFQPKQQRRMQARIAIECLRNGEAVQYELQKRGWSNFHPHRFFNNKIPSKDADSRKVGIYTNAWLRPQMMDMLLTCVDEEAIDLPSPYLVKEIEALERDEREQKAKAAYGEHDDRVMAIMFPLYSLHVGERPQQQYRRRVEFVPGGEPPDVVEYPIWSPPAQSLSVGPQPLQAVTQGRGLRRRYGLRRYVNPRMPEGFQ